MSSRLPMPDLSTHFDDPFLSDFQLRLVTADPKELARFHVHGIVLAGQSGYFKSLLQNWMGQDARIFSVTIAEDELPAARQMLQCAYSNSMPDDATAEQLLATMILADRYQLRVCVEACKDRLLCVKSKDLSWHTALALLHLPAGLREGEAFAALIEKAHQRVWESFRYLDDAWTDRALRSQWQQLPFEAVECVLSNEKLSVTGENVVYIVTASWLAAQLRQHTTDLHQLCQIQQAARQLLSSMRYSQMTGNFLAAVASHHGLLASQPEVARWLLEAMQYSRATDMQKREMQACAAHMRFKPRGHMQAGGSAFTSYIAASDLQQAVAKYRASNCSEAYYLLTAGHFFNGFTWRLKLTVKPPDAGSANDMNIHVGLCWGIEIEGEGQLPLADTAMVQVDFDIATWDFTLHEEDPTSSEGPVSMPGVCASPTVCYQYCMSSNL
eukprot:GHRR01005106.1.p1 GENE.GHRR01005106.1~~GHRR01005106.1.p1  ORF type:complete len:441 (+),score=138.90 GHRR01005106.1:334-1656(+)